MDHTDAMAEHRATQQIRDNLPAEFDDRGDIAEAVTGQFTIAFERRVNEHGMAVRRVIMYGPEEVDPTVKTPTSAPALFEVTSSVAAA